MLAVFRALHPQVYTLSGGHAEGKQVPESARATANVLAGNLWAVNCPLPLYKVSKSVVALGAKKILFCTICIQCVVSHNVFYTLYSMKTCHIYPLSVLSKVVSRLLSGNLMPDSGLLYIPPSATLRVAADSEISEAARSGPELESNAIARSAISDSGPRCLLLLQPRMPFMYQRVLSIHDF